MVVFSPFGEKTLMGEIIFITGFPGFLGKRVVKRLLADPTTDEVHCLVQERFRGAAEQALAGMENGSKGKLVTGDITLRGLGIPEESDLRKRVTLAFHLAAAYNLALPRDAGMKVNVEGTRNVLDWLDGAPSFKRLAYVSTCAISGSHVGVFSEDDFDVGQTFKNYYEETKYLAEYEVRNRWGRVPVAIFRPPVVVGDSKTGEAEKIDGPYYAFVMIMRNMHKIAARSRARLNVAPVDYVVDAMLEIFKRPGSVGRVWSLSDPSPLTFDDFFDVTADAFGKPRSMLRLPSFVFRPLFKLPGLAERTGIPAQSFDYSLVPVDWTCAHTLKALEGTGIRCPRYPEYAPTLVRYFQENLARTLPKAGSW